jgi:hypothetical protein
MGRNEKKGRLRKKLKQGERKMKKERKKRGRGESGQRIEFCGRKRKEKLIKRKKWRMGREKKGMKGTIR